MTLDELVGGALVAARDPEVASRRLLVALLSSDAPTKASLAGSDLDLDLVLSLRRKLQGDQLELAIACARGCAWALGRRSAQAPDTWEPVLTAPVGRALPSGVQRTTAETLTALVNLATRSVRFVAPFFDVTGASFLGDPLAAATARGVRVELYLPPDVASKAAPVRVLASGIRRGGDAAYFSVLVAKASTPWPHLKVMVADSIAAYVGSANITEKGLREGNLEFGVLLQGPQAQVIEDVISLIPAERLTL